jgi:hypothetical protein
MVFEIVRRGGWSTQAVANGDPRGAIKLKSTQIRWFMWWAGRLDPVGGGQDIQRKLNLKGDYQAWVHSGQMVLLVVTGREAGLHEWYPRCSKKSENNFRQPKDLLIGQSDSPTKKGSTYSLSRGCWRGEIAEAYDYQCFTLSPGRPYEEYKRMVFEHTHGLFIT